MKLRKRTKRIFYLCFWGIFATGTLDWIFDRWVRVQGAFGPEHHPAQPWLSRMHTVCAYLILVAFGYLLHSHVRPGLKGNRRKISGISMVTFLSLLAASSLPILYAADGIIRDASTAIHTYMGLSIPLLLGFHLLSRRQSAEAPKNESEQFPKGLRVGWQDARIGAAKPPANARSAVRPTYQEDARIGAAKPPANARSAVRPTYQKEQL